MMNRRDFVCAMAAAGSFGSPRGVLAGTIAARLGTMRLTSAATVFVAVDKGYFAEEGLPVEVVFFDAAAQLPVAAVAHSIDFGMTAFTAAFFNLAAKGGLKLICGDGRPHVAFPNNQLVASRAGREAGLRGFADIRGRRLGVTTIGSSFHYQIGAIAAKFGFSIADVELVPLQTLQNLVPSVASGRLDGAILPSTAAEPLVQSGAAIFVGNLAEVDTTQASGVFTRPDVIAGRREHVERFIRAHRRAMAFCNTAVNRLDEAGRPIESEEREELFAIVAKSAGQNGRQIAGTFSFYEPHAPLYLEHVRKVLRFWQDQGLVARTLDAESVIDFSFGV